MEQQSNFTRTSSPLQSLEEGMPPSKTKILLKRQINQISNSKDIASSNSVRQPLKLAAPKPVRPKVHAFNNHSNAKWIQQSPVKSECVSNQVEGAMEDTESKLQENKEFVSPSFELRRVDFRAKLNGSETQQEALHSNTDEQQSYMKSLMQAEEEMSAIFSKPKSKQNLQNGGWSMWSPNSSLSKATASSNSSTLNQIQPGFSIYDHFQAPLKRPSCNPLAKELIFSERPQSPLRIAQTQGLSNLELDHLSLERTQLLKDKEQEASSFNQAPLDPLIQNPFDCLAKRPPRLDNSGMLYQNQFANVHNNSGDNFEHMLSFSQVTSPTNLSHLQGQLINNTAFAVQMNQSQLSQGAFYGNHFGNQTMAFPAFNTFDQQAFSISNSAPDSFMLYQQQFYAPMLQISGNENFMM